MPSFLIALLLLDSKEEEALGLAAVWLIGGLFVNFIWNNFCGDGTDTGPAPALQPFLWASATRH
jgi:hypothetical protein